MKQLAIVSLVLMTTGCASLDVACRSAMDAGGWSLVKNAEERKKWLQVSQSAEDGRVFVNQNSGAVAVCNACSGDTERVESIKYLDGEEIVGIEASTCGLY